MKKLTSIAACFVCLAVGLFTGKIWGNIERMEKSKKSPAELQKENFPPVAIFEDAEGNLHLKNVSYTIKRNKSDKPTTGFIEFFSNKSDSINTVLQKYITENKRKCDITRMYGFTLIKTNFGDNLLMTQINY